MTDCGDLLNLTGPEVTEDFFGPYVGEQDIRSALRELKQEGVLCSEAEGYIPGELVNKVREIRARAIANSILRLPDAIMPMPLVVEVISTMVSMQKEARHAETENPREAEAG